MLDEIVCSGINQNLPGINVTKWIMEKNNLGFLYSKNMANLEALILQA